MRIGMAGVGLVLVGLATVSCAPLGRGIIPSGPAGQDVAVVDVPPCRFWVVKNLSGRIAGATAAFGGAPDIQNQARGLGADALMNFHVSQEFDSRGNVIAANWTAVAIAYWDRTNASCYRS